MKILMIAPSDVDRAPSGVARSSSRLAAALQAEGALVERLPFGLDEIVGGRNIPRRRFELIRGPGRVPAFSRQLAEFAPDVLHAHGLMGPARVAMHQGAVPIVITAHGHPLADARFSHGKVGYLVRVPLLRHRARAAIDAAAAVVSPAEEQSANLPFQARRFVHIPNIVEDTFFLTGERARRATRRVLFVGGSRPIKGWDRLRKAWPLVRRAVPDSELHVYGWEMTPPPDMPGVRFLPAVDAAGLADAHHQAAVLVVPSRYEVAPLAVSEAWAAGTLVIAAAVGGLKACGDAALLWDMTSPTSLAVLIIDALLRRTDTRHLVASGRSRAEGCRSHRVAQAHLDVYEGLR